VYREGPQVIVYGTGGARWYVQRAEELLTAVEAASSAAALEPAYWMLGCAAAGSGIKLAPSGRLGRRVVRDDEARFRFTSMHEIDSTPQTQDDVPPLPTLRVLLTRAGLVRARKGFLVSTKAGAGALDARGDEVVDRALFVALCACLCARDSFEDELTSLLLIELLPASRCA
jgi:hypothetical protein